MADPTLLDYIRQKTPGVNVQDGLRQFYLANGATGGTLNDLERQFLAAQPQMTPGGTLNDLWMKYTQTGA